MHFRVATYNVHKCKGVDWRVSPARIADVIAGLNADIVATQEILFSQAEAIAKHLGVPFTFGAARQHAGEPYGNAVFTKLAISSSESYDITVEQHEPRQCLRVSALLANNIPIHFFAVHLGTSYTERRRQAPMLVQHLSASGLTTNRIVAGDFNEWTRGLATQLFSEQFRSADITVHLKRRTTYPGILSFLHLDHIYYDESFQLHQMHLERNRLSLLASDHLPLFATFTIC